ncbi:hypothetical protein F4860DRAFT_488020 [Xylaria cubensis]|nr:hypothetical protein F4860DRAFT_488020 [Xylaria cubensis]
MARCLCVCVMQCTVKWALARTNVQSIEKGVAGKEVLDRSLPKLLYSMARWSKPVFNGSELQRASKGIGGVAPPNSSPFLHPVASGRREADGTGAPP